MKFGWPKKADKPDSVSLPWNEDARRALEQALQQVPQAKFMAGILKKKMRKAAEAQARARGGTEVTAQDLVGGMLAMAPPAVRAQIEDKMREAGVDPTKLPPPPR